MEILGAGITTFKIPVEQNKCLSYALYEKKKRDILF